jgi:hypothetical protein
MWMFPRVFGAALVTAMMLSGCVDAMPQVSGSPSPKVTPVFATEEEALAAATEAYREYVRVSDEVFADGGTNPERMKSVAVGDQLTADLVGFRKALSMNVRSTGGTTFQPLQLQQHDENLRQGRSIVVVYLCEDVSMVDVVDAHGASVVSSTRPNVVSYEVRFYTKKDMPHCLLVSGKEPWPRGQC